jgi:hypothetical protein
MSRRLRLFFIIIDVEANYLVKRQEDTREGKKSTNLPVFVKNAEEVED